MVARLCLGDCLLVCLIVCLAVCLVGCWLDGWLAVLVGGCVGWLLGWIVWLLASPRRPARDPRGYGAVTAGPSYTRVKRTRT